MDQNELLDLWHRYRKSSYAYYRLRETLVCTYTYRGPQQGHPSNYAGVKFCCEAADTLSFSVTAVWPQAVGNTYAAQLEAAIAVAVVDGLASRLLVPYRGCTVTLIEADYNEVMSSEVAFYRAARGAIEELVAQGKWDYISTNVV